VHHAGDALRLIASRDRDHLGPGAATGADRFDVTLGSRDIDVFQAVVPGGWWQTAEPLAGPNGYALVGCVVAPGFDFEDFEMV